jgi:hypothetical protein
VTLDTAVRPSEAPSGPGPSLGLARQAEATTGPSGTVLLLAVEAKLTAGILATSQPGKSFNWFDRGATLETSQHR